MDGMEGNEGIGGEGRSLPKIEKNGGEIWKDGKCLLVVFGGGARQHDASPPFSHHQNQKKRKKKEKKNKKNKKNKKWKPTQPRPKYKTYQNF